MSNPVAGEEFSFEMAIDLYALIQMGDMEQMNDMMDNEFQHQFPKYEHLAVTDINYETVRIDEDKNIVIKVTGLMEDMSGEDVEYDDHSNW